MTFALCGIASIVAVAIIDSFKPDRTKTPVMIEPHDLLDRVSATSAPRMSAPGTAVTAVDTFRVKS